MRRPPVQSQHGAWSQAGTTVDIDYTCQLGAGARYCPQLPGSTQLHQCMLFEIAPSPDAMGAPGFNIQPPAVVCRDMDFGSQPVPAAPGPLVGLAAALLIWVGVTRHPRRAARGRP